MILTVIYGRNDDVPIIRKMLTINKIVIITILLLFSSLPSYAGTTISLDKMIDTPDKTVTYQGKNYEIRSIGSYIEGESVTIDVNSTNLRSFQLSLLDKNQDFLWNHMVYTTEEAAGIVMPGDIITTPGTYAFAIFYQGDIRAVMPVVFSQYSISIIPNRTKVAPGEGINIKIEVKPDTSIPMTLILAKDSDRLEFPVKRNDDNSYGAEIKIPNSANGTFTLYATLLSHNIILGYPESVGLSNGVSINVIENPLPDKSAGLPSYMGASIFLAYLLIILFKRI